MATLAAAGAILAGLLFSLLGPILTILLLVWLFRRRRRKRGEQRIATAGIEIPCTVTEIWTELFAARNGPVRYWRVDAQGDVPGGYRETFTSDRLRADPRPAITLGTPVLVRMDPQGQFSRMDLPPLPRTRPTGDGGPPTPLTPKRLWRYAGLAAIAGIALTAHGIIVDFQPTQIVGPLMLAAAAICAAWASYEMRIQHRLTRDGTRFQLRVMDTLRQASTTALGTQDTAWFLTLDGHWPDGQHEHFTACSTDPNSANLQPGDQVTVMGDPVSRRLRLAPSPFGPG